MGTGGSSSSHSSSSTIWTPSLIASAVRKIFSGEYGCQNKKNNNNNNNNKTIPEVSLSFLQNISFVCLQKANISSAKLLYCAVPLPWQTVVNTVVMCSSSYPGLSFGIPQLFRSYIVHYPTYVTKFSHAFFFIDVIVVIHCGCSFVT